MGRSKTVKIKDSGSLTAVGVAFILGTTGLALIQRHSVREDEWLWGSAGESQDRSGGERSDEMHDKRVNCVYL